MATVYICLHGGELVRNLLLKPTRTAIQTSMQEAGFETADSSTERQRPTFWTSFAKNNAVWPDTHDFAHNFSANGGLCTW